MTGAILHCLRDGEVCLTARFADRDRLADAVLKATEIGWQTRITYLDVHVNPTPEPSPTARPPLSEV